MSKKETETSLVPVAGQSLIIAPEKSLLLRVAGVALRGQAQDLCYLVINTPGSLEKARSFARSHPFIIDTNSDKLEERPTIDNIRRDFPNIINHFTDYETADIISVYPSVSMRFMEEKKTLEKLPVTHSIKDIELVLKILTEEGLFGGLDPEHYYNVVNLLNVAANMGESLETKGIMLDGKEADNLRKLILRLNLTKKLFELDGDGLDEGYGTTRQKSHASRRLEYLAGLAEIRVQQRVVWTFRASGIKNLGRLIENMEGFLVDIKERMWEDFPEFRGEFLEIYRGVPFNKSWIMEPGVADFLSPESYDRADITDFCHQGAG